MLAGVDREVDSLLFLVNSLLFVLTDQTGGEAADELGHVAAAVEAPPPPWLAHEHHGVHGGGGLGGVQLGEHDVLKRWTDRQTDRKKGKAKQQAGERRWHNEGDGI